MEIASVQKAEKYNIDETKKQLEDYIQEYRNNSDEYEDEMEEWFELLKDCLFDEIDYVEAAYRQKPSHIDYEDVPFGTKRCIWLGIVYDAFNEICRRYE